MVRTPAAVVRHAVALALVLLIVTSATGAAGDIVRAVLFYSPSCSHCHFVITEVLPPLMERYGSSFKVIGIDISSEGGNAMYLAAVQQYQISDDRFGVPCLIIGDHDLVGDVEVRDQLPILIEEYLASGGVDLPRIPGLAEALAAREPTPTPEAVPSAEQADTIAPSTEGTLQSDLSMEQPTIAGKLARDPVGNGLSVLVLLALIASIVRAIFVLSHPPAGPDASWNRWAILALAVIGAGIAGYLAFVESTRTPAVCGPVGDCNAVQQSRFALLFDVLPVGVLGLAGYVAILIAWLVGAKSSGTVATIAQAALFAMALFGVSFSTYLTFLEPFVIGATCAWCLSSAVVMLSILTLSSGTGARAIAEMRASHSGPSQQTTV